MQEVPIPSHHTDWLLFVLIGAGVLLISARLYDPLRFKAFARLPLHVKRPEIEQSFSASIRKGGFDLSLSLLSYVMLSLGLYIVVQPASQGLPHLNEWWSYLRLFFATTVFFVVKDLVGLSIGYVFGSIDLVARGQNVGLAYRSWLGMWLAPLCLLVLYSGGMYDFFYWVLLVSLILGYYISLQFAFVHFWKLPANSFYKFFYLCALEITPLLFFLTWLKSLVQ